MSFNMIETLTTFTGEQVKYDADKHKYYSMDDVPLIGASSYAKRFGKSFDKASILPRTAQSWELRRKTSTIYGVSTDG